MWIGGAKPGGGAGSGRAISRTKGRRLFRERHSPVTLSSERSGKTSSTGVIEEARTLKMRVAVVHR